MPKGYQPRPGARSAPTASKPKLWNCKAGGRGRRYGDGWHDNRGRVFATQEQIESHRRLVVIRGAGVRVADLPGSKQAEMGVI